MSVSTIEALPAGRSPDRTWPLAVGLVLAVQVLAVNFWPAFPSPNEWPRVHQALAIVHRGALDIGPEQARFGASEDVAVHDGRSYPNKAPGLLPLLLPGAWLAHLASPCGGITELRMAVVIGRLLASTVPFWMTLLLLRRKLTAEETFLAAAWGFASPALSASLLLFSHALAACLLLAGWALLYRDGTSTWRGDLAAGLLLGWAAACEYPLAVPAAVLVVAVAGPSRWRRYLATAVGGMLPAMGLAAYNWACFGAPWSLSSAHEAHAGYAALQGSGLFGIGAPALGGLAGLLLSPTRGLLVWFPLCLLSGAALPWAYARIDRPRGVAALAGLSLLLLMAGYRNWHGGWFPGPRYLLAALPLLLLAAAPGVRALRRWAAARVTLGVVALWGATAAWLSVASFPFPPEDIPVPFLTLSPGLLADGITFPSMAKSWIWLSLVLAGCLTTAWTLLRPAGTPRERALAVGLAVVALLGTQQMVRTPTTWKARLETAVIRDAYGDGRGRGALTDLSAHCQTPAQCQQVARWLAALRPPGE